MYVYGERVFFFVRMREALIFIFVVLCFLSCRDAAVIDLPTTLQTPANLQLIFNTKHDKIYSLNLDPTHPSTSTLKPATTITVSLESCHKNVTIPNLSNIVDFDVTDEDIIWISWNDRIYMNDSLIMWYEYYDYQQFSQRRLAVDRANKLIYSIDRFISPWVELIDFEGKRRRILFGFEGGDETKDFLFEGKMPEELVTATFKGMLYEPEFPLDIVVDEEEGLLFVMTKLNGIARIHKATVDGKHRTLLVLNAGKVVNDDCGRLAIQSGRIYWTDCAEGAIESVDFEGKNRSVVIREENLLALAVSDSWVIWSTNSTDAAINMCRMIDNVCDENSIAKISLKQLNNPIYKIRVQHHTYQLSKPSKICPHLTLNGQCICRNGFISTDNGKRCVPVTKYLVYENNNYLVSRSLEPYSSDEIYNFQPQFVWGLLEKDQMASMDYDESTGRLFYAECRNLLQLKLEEDMRGCWFVEKNETDCLKHVAYDSRRMDLFMVRQDGVDNKYYLEMANLGTKKFQRFTYLIPTTLIEVDEPLALIVHADLLFLLDASSRLSIYNIGENVTLSSITNLKARVLTMDGENKRLYWYDDEGRIGYVSFTGAGDLVGKSPIDGVNAMVVDDEWIYLKNKRSIWRMDKNSGGNAECVVAEKKNTKLRSTMKIIRRSPDRLTNQATESACEVFCAYNWDRLAEESYEKDVEFCKCLR